VTGPQRVSFGAAAGAGGAGGGSAMAVEGSGDEVAMAAGSASGGSGGTTMAAAARIHSLAVLRDTPHSRAAAETLPMSSGRSTSCAIAATLPVLAGPLRWTFFGRRGSAPLPWVQTS
jgi:hypothetical protein